MTHPFRRALSGPGRRRDLLLAGLILTLAAFLLVAGCGSDEDSSGADHDAGHGGMTTDGELFEETAGFGTLPGFLKDYTDHTSELYAAVADYAALLKTIDCYCGCMRADNPHDSLYRCYVAETRADGSVVWTDHSANCGICKMELEDVIKLSKQGLSDDEIREAVEAKYKPAGL